MLEGKLKGKTEVECLFFEMPALELIWGNPNGRFYKWVAEPSGVVSLLIAPGAPLAKINSSDASQNSNR
jgi:hypothetical protein